MDSEQKVVLLIEDNSNDVLLFQRALQRSKLPELPELRVVNNIEAAILYLTQQPPYQDRQANPLPNLVLTDLRLPGKSGLELVQWLKQQPDLQSLPVVMLTGSALDADIDTAYELGVDFCLVKPQDFSALVNVILALSVYWIPPPQRGKLNIDSNQN